ncbi:hypothetical protein ACFX2I_003630 [Malus domestica]
MSQLITRRRSVSNAAPALLASSAPGVSAPLIGEPTPLTEATPTTSQVPVSSTSSVSVEPLVHGGLTGAAASQSLLITLPRPPESRIGPPNQLKKTLGGPIEC